MLNPRALGFLSYAVAIAIIQSALGLYWMAWYTILGALGLWFIGTLAIVYLHAIHPVIVYLLHAHRLISKKTVDRQIDPSGIFIDYLLVSDDIIIKR